MAEGTRPYRSLCPEADERDAMDDGEFWQRVARNLGVNTEHDQPWYDGPELDDVGQDEPCPTCGSTGACGYDSEGRALIHATEDTDDD